MVIFRILNYFFTARENAMIKKLFLAFALLTASFGYAQTVGGYWYGPAFAQTKNSASNYLIELILKDNNGKLQGALNYILKTVSAVYRLLEVIMQRPVTLHFTMFR